MSFPQRRVEKAGLAQVVRREKPSWLNDTQCTGKHRFDDATLAKKIARLSASRNNDKISAYRCQFCNGWHVGHNKPKSDRRKEMKDRERGAAW